MLHVTREKTDNVWAKKVNKFISNKKIPEELRAQTLEGKYVYNIIEKKIYKNKK